MDLDIAWIVAVIGVIVLLGIGWILLCFSWFIRSDR
jgi:hypothetical protein